MNSAAGRPPILLLIAASSLSPFALTVCAPALPMLGREFDLPGSTIQFAVSIFLLGLMLAQPVHGVLADRYGRRSVLLWSFSLFTLSSMACGLANSMPLLVIFRFLQAFGIAASFVVARAIIQDMCDDDDDAARYTAYLAGGMAISPMFAPVLAGYLIEVSGWRMIFHVTTGLALAVLAWLLLVLPETIRQVQSVGNAFSQMGGNIAELLKSRLFLGYSLIICFINAIFFAFLTSAPLYFQEQLHVEPALFGIYMGVCAFTYICGTFSSSVLIQRRGMQHTLRLGVVGTFFSGLLVTLAFVFFGNSVFMILVPFMLLFAFTGVGNPPALSAVLMNHPDKAATASGLSNSMTVGTGALATALTALVYNDTALSLSLPMIILVTLPALTYLLLVRNRG